ncbi:MAG: acyclic terpene utilization AtuA family protein [Bryobacteraceae bacterium]|jgi:hypothetical protein
MIRVANGQGFWGDWLEAPARLLEQGPIDYLTLDYLAEVTMAVLEKQRRRNPELGYAADFPPLMEREAPRLKQKRVRVVTNAGGLNPRACAREVLRRAPGLKVAIVEGDAVAGRIDEFLAKGYPLNSIDTGEPIAKIQDRILSANAYLGALPLAQALAAGADVVISGRCADSALVLAPCIHAFGWRADAWDLLAAGTTAGHIVECGAQTTGGNSQVDWREIPDLDEIGYPIAEIDPDGTFVITKHAGTGGRVTADIVKEQLLYEIGDPHSYLTPDVIADFTGLDLADVEPDRVRITGARGRQRPACLKLSINYAAGWKATGTLVYTAPDAIAKAQAADRIVRRRLEKLGLRFDEIYTEYLGWNACQGDAAPPACAVPEVQLRIGVRGQQRSAVDRFTREMAPLVLSGPPGATGYGGEGRPKVREVIGNWGALLPREEIRPTVEVVE